MQEREEPKRDEKPRTSGAKGPSLDEQKSDPSRLETGDTGVIEPERAVVEENLRKGRKPHPER